MKGMEALRQTGRWAGAERHRRLVDALRAKLDE